MPIVDDFFSELRRNSTPCAKWHKVDLHNHSPASDDFRGNRSTALGEFAEQIRRQRLSVVMFTDHERLPDADFVRELSRQTGALVIAGLELNVFVDAFGKPADKVGKEVCFHLLIGFDPDGQFSPAYWVEHLYRECRVEERSFGSVQMRGVVASIDKIYETLKDSGAFLIPAHLHSGSGAFKSRSVDVVYGDKEFLRWAGNFFTALDVRSDSTAKFFDGRHKETGFLEKSCTRSSDAHEPSELGQFPTWLQMEKVCFRELKSALELPSRVSRVEPTSPPSYVEGIHVEGQFLRDFWMTLSPNLNVLIGVKGSGKTSILECLRFGLGSEVPVERRKDVAAHLNAILGPGGRVRLLVRRDDGARLLVERKTTDALFRVWFEDDRVVESASPEVIRFPSAILGWHEIEHAATDRQIRRLHMDAIAGRDEVNRLTEEATRNALSIRQMHESASAKYSEYVDLMATVARQEAMREGLQQLQDANLIELRDQMSNALASQREMERLREHLRSLPADIPTRTVGLLQLDQFQFNPTPPLSEPTERVASEINEITTVLSGVSGQLLSILAQKQKSVDEHIATATKQFAEFAEDYRARLQALSPEVQRLLESHRDVLEKTRELPTLKVRLAQLRTEIESALTQLSQTAEVVAEKLDERLTLRARKVEEFNAELATAEVVLSVVPGAAKDDEFAPTFSQFGHSKEVLDELRKNHGGTRRFHRTLAAAYEELRKDLMSGDRVLFSRADFGRLIPVLENDDLEIRFAVGKPGERFSPIDQLSAGQRCTAVFPILLKLKDGPLVIDQPEDNLDNRHIAKNVATVLIDDKRARQIVLTSHNANLVVLSDPECIAVFDAAEGLGKLSVAGFLAHRDSPVTSHVLDILDGGERALEMRSMKYGRGHHK